MHLLLLRPHGTTGPPPYNLEGSVRIVLVDTGLSAQLVDTGLSATVVDTALTGRMV